MKNPTLKKIRDLQNKLLYNEINYNQEQSFIDYLNLNPHLYDGTGVDKKTINLINSEFSFYNVFTKNFYFIFRLELNKAYPIYRAILQTEMRTELFNLSTNIRYRNLADRRLNSNFAITNQQVDTEAEGSAQTNGNNTSQSNGDVKTANKQLPLSQVGNGDLDDLFEWDTATFINEEDSSNRETNTNSNTTITANTNKQTLENKLKSILKDMNWERVDEKALNQQAVKSINAIINYLWEENKAKDYLFNKLRKCFVLVD